MSKKKNTRKASSMSQNRLGGFLRKPAGQLTAVAIVALIVYLIAASTGGNASTAASEISVDQAYEKYQAGTFLLDVRTQEEWDEYHAPNTTLIPLDELPT